MLRSTSSPVVSCTHATRNFERTPLLLLDAGAPVGGDGEEGEEREEGEREGELTCTRQVDEAEAEESAADVSIVCVRRCRQLRGV